MLVNFFVDSDSERGWDHGIGTNIPFAIGIKIQIKDNKN
jgi:hypothetical protein